MDNSSASYNWMSGDLEAATPRDPRVDFAAWSEWRESQALAGLELRDVRPEDWAAEVDRTMHACYDEIDAMAAELGIPVAPCDLTTEQTNLLVAFDVAAKEVLDSKPLERGLSSHEAFELMIERGLAIARGEVAPHAGSGYETEAREKLATLIERRSRGDSSYARVAQQVRRSVFSQTLRAARLRVMPRVARLERRPREHRARGHRRGTRGDPARSEDADAPAYPTETLLLRGGPR